MCLAPTLGVVAALVLGQQEFSDLWYRETYLGEVAQAYEGYRRIYLSSEKLPEETRRRAAYRAGACAEKLGDAERARRDYEWFTVNGSPEDPWTKRALLRLARLEDAPAAAVEPGAAEKADVASRRAAALARVRKAARERRTQLERLHRLSLRLRGVGAELVWPVDSTPSPEREAGGDGAPDTMGVALDGLLRSFQLHPDDERLLRETLAHSLHVEGLLALRGRDLRRAARALRLQLGCAVEPSVASFEARELLASIRALDAFTDGLVRGAERRLAGVVEARESAHLAKMTQALREAKRHVGMNELDAALQALDAVLALEHWAPGGVRSDGRSRSLVQEAQLQRGLLARVGDAEGPSAADAVPPALERGRSAVAERDGARLAKEIVVGSTDAVLALLALPAIEAGAQPALLDPERMLPRATKDVERLVERLELHRDVDTLDAASIDALEDSLVLIGWFPTLDGDGRLRRRIERLLGR